MTKLGTAQRALDLGKYVTGLAPISPSSSTPDYVSLKGYSTCDVIIMVDNGATVTGSDITLKQATAVAGTSEKALAFSTMYANTDTGAGDTLVSTAVTSNTFTTDNTNAKNLLYIVTVDANDLDVDGGFDCIRAGTGNTTNAVVSVLYYLYGARYSPTFAVSAVTD